jgi:hypothetical protein
MDGKVEANVDLSFYLLSTIDTALLPQGRVAFGNLSSPPSEPRLPMETISMKAKLLQR